MKIVLAGSRRINSDTLRFRLVQLLKEAPDGAEIHLRRGKWVPMGEFERLVSNIVLDLQIQEHKKITTVFHVPEPTDSHPGRASVYLRDIEMIEAADIALLFFDPDEAVMGYSGTAHLLDKALDAGITVEAYTVDAEGRTHWIGGYEGEKR